MNFLLLYHYTVTAALLVVLINFIVNNILFKNIASFTQAEQVKNSPPLVSVLIPARDEAKNIKRCIRSLLKQDYPNIEILVLDDNSSDGTGQIVRQMRKKDSRVRLITGKPLKNGWMGKSYACHQLSKCAKGDYFVFTDADTLHFSSSVSNAVNCLTANNLDALSAYPMQIMVTIHERMLITFISFAILSFLPLVLIKKSRHPLFCTAIGQFMLFKRDVYKKIGGHKSIKKEILDDVKISKQVKRCGYKFMIFDGSGDIYCRMYRNFSGAVKGYSKVIFAAFDFHISIQFIVTVLITILFLLPFILLPLGILVYDLPAIVINLITLQVAIIFVIRGILAIRFRSRVLDAFLHPLSMLYIILVSINSILQSKIGAGIYWKGRVYDASSDRDELKLVKDSSEEYSPDLGSK